MNQQIPFDKSPDKPLRKQIITDAIRHELHFGDRMLRCFQYRPRSVAQLLKAAIERNPDGEALVHERSRINYSQLDALTAFLATHLDALGIVKGDRVALLLGNRPEFIVMILALARLGAIAVPLNTRLQTPELAYILDHCGAKLLVHESELGSRLPAAEKTPALRYRYAVGTADPAKPAEMNISDLLQPVTTVLPDCDVLEEEVAVILYTSGTTGRPKGALLTHFNIIHSALHYQFWMGLSAEDRSIMPVPASHVTGLIANIIAMLNVAGCTILLPIFKAKAWLELAQRERITHTVMVPAMYKLCLLEPSFGDYDLSAWRIGAYGGAPMPEATIAELALKLPRLQLMNAYGATETTSPTTLMPLGATASHSDSVGQVVACGEVLVMDQNHCEVALGMAGEIWIKGPMVVPGYWQNSAATAESFRGGYWRSGDIGSLDKAGYLRVFDRIKDMINRGGYKVYSVEVENILSHHPAVIECAVVAQTDSVLGEKIHAFVQLSQSDIDVEVLKNFCAERLADYKIPDYITVSTQPLPRNANGKLLKRALRESLP